MKFFSNLKQFYHHHRGVISIELALVLLILGVGTGLAINKLSDVPAAMYCAGTEEKSVKFSGKTTQCDQYQSYSGQTILSTDFSDMNSNNRWAPGFDNYGAGSYVGGWHVDSGTIDMVDGSKMSHLSKGDGNQDKYIDLDGLSSGKISQSMPTVPGKTYTVTFSHSGNMANSLTKKLNVSAGNTTTQFTKTDNHWTQESFTFTATSDTTKISFAGQNEPCCWGSLLTNISVTMN